MVIQRVLEHGNGIAAIIPSSIPTNTNNNDHNENYILCQWSVIIAKYKTDLLLLLLNS